MGDRVDYVLRPLEELLQDDLGIDSAIGIHLTDEILCGSFYVALALAEVDAVAAGAARWLGHQRPLPAGPRPLQQLGLSAGEELLRGGNPTLAQPLLHLRLVLPSCAQLRAVGRRQLQRLRQQVGDRHARLAPSEDCGHLVGQLLKLVKKRWQVLVVNRLCKVLLVRVIGAQEEAAEVKRGANADDWQATALQLVEQETTR
mmetsp:Transcript_16445/g.37065  ORF Transcript_16445/g.37065 Transcript_16445/m.37065 type:complete len:201 (+) Transcript_16445:216-818(+)